MLTKGTPTVNVHKFSLRFFFDHVGAKKKATLRYAKRKKKAP